MPMPRYNEVAVPKRARNRALLALAALAVFGAFMRVPVSASAGETCPNEVLREEFHSTLLPGCRVYEMVSPPYKEGYELFLDTYSSDGEKAIISSFATLDHTLGSGEEAGHSNFYLAARYATGWRLSALNASSSQFVGQLLLGSEADDGETLWAQHTPAQPASFVRLYVRSPIGVYSLVGPDRPDESYEEEPSNAVDKASATRLEPAATTHDFSHIVLQAFHDSQSWPFDETVGEPFRSLYEYSGTNNPAPLLVGVEGEKGSHDLIAKCGTVLGSESGSTYNALSVSGETIFFTVRSCASTPAEVYARVHGALISPSPAETVHVSANVCKTACGEESGKNFEGASEDGTRVFFTSTQKLTETAVDGTADGDATQGACAGTAPNTGGCNLYEYDMTRKSLKAISIGGEVRGVAGIAEDGSRIYYVSLAKPPSAGTNMFGEPPLAEQPNLYVYDTTSEETKFIATLSAANDSEDWAHEFPRPAEVARSNGRYLLFASAASQLTPDDTATSRQLFEYKAEGDGEPAELVRVTKGEEGFNEDGNGVNVGVPTAPLAETGGFPGTDFKQTADPLNISKDGHTIAFVTPGQLSARAVSAIQGCRSVYEFHTDSNALSQGTVGLISDGRDIQGKAGTPCGVGFLGMDGSGADIMFRTADPLLPPDVDGLQSDIYDARVNGGFAAASSPLPCVAPGGCQASSGGGAVGLVLPDSASQAPEVASVGLSLTPSATSGKSKGAGAHKRRVSALTKALHGCRRRPRGSARARCERAVHHRYAGSGRR